jgi:predicted nucleic acid-binding protein
LSVYFDTSVIVSLFLPDGHTLVVHRWLAHERPVAFVSNWAAAEFSSALALRMKVGGATVVERNRAERAFDLWLASGVQWIETASSDFEIARRLIRHDQAAVRTPDALHLAIASRLNLELATLDVRLADAGRQLGLAVSAL